MLHSNVIHLILWLGNSTSTSLQQIKLYRWKVISSSNHNGSLQSQVQTTDTDETVLSCQWCAQSWRQPPTVFSSPQYTGDWTVFSSPICSVNVFANKFCSHHISRLDKTVKKTTYVQFQKLSVANGLDLSPILFTPSTQTRQSHFVRFGGVNWA